MSRRMLFLILVSSCSFVAQGHELPDEEIERRVQVSVKPGRVLVQYSLAMNEVTLKKELWKFSQDTDGTFSELLKRYEKVIPLSLSNHLQLEVDGSVFPIHPVGVEYSGWSHRYLTCLFRGEVQLAATTKTITVTDNNFRDTPGGYRIAMKGISGARMEPSSVPPTVSRATSVVLKGMSQREKEAATTVTGKFSIVESSEFTPKKLSHATVHVLSMRDTCLVLLGNMLEFN